MSSTRYEQLSREVQICITKIEYLEKNIARLEGEIKSKENSEKTENRFVTNKRLTICMIIATIGSPLILLLFEWIFKV